MAADEQSPAEVVAIKAVVRHRDGHRCTECGRTASEHVQSTGRNLDVHRLTPGSRYSIEGCVTLCRSCHAVKPKSPRRGFRVEPNCYASIRIDERVLPLARAAAALSGDVSTQEFISDAVNRAAAEVLKRPPLKRLPAPPKPHGKGRPKPAR